jgi:hypothetical protein
MSRTSFALVLQQACLFEHLKVTGGRRPRVFEARGDLARRGAAAAEVQRQQDLTSRRVRDGVDHRIERGQLLCGSQRWVALRTLQSGSTSQMVSSSSTGPIGSHTAITSGI